MSDYLDGSKKVEANIESTEQQLCKFIEAGDIELELLPSIPRQFSLNNEGVSYRNKDGILSPVCGPVLVDADAFDSHNSQWKRRVIFYNRKGELQTCYLTNKDLLTVNNAVGALMDKGLKVCGNQGPRLLCQYIMEQAPKAEVEIVAVPGWHQSGKFFVRPSGIIRDKCDNSDSNIEFHPSTPNDIYDALTDSGSLEDWKSAVSQVSLGHPVLMLAQCLGLAAPLLKPLNAEPIGVDVSGPSSMGKTTAGCVAASIVGCGEDPATGHRSAVCGANTTLNAVELMAEPFNDAVLVLDEHGSSSLNDLSKLMYQIPNGRGKKRMNADATQKPQASWRCNTMTTGEFPIHEGAAKLKAGQLVRFLSLPVAELKVIRAEPEAAAKIADQLKVGCATYYGTALPAFVENLLGRMSNDPDYVDQLKGRLQEIHTEYCDEYQSPQVRRAIKRFALLALAGELGCEFGVLCGDATDYRAAIQEVKNFWLSHSSPVSDEERGLDNLREFIVKNPGKFPNKDAANDRCTDLAGYRDVESGYLLFSKDGLLEASGHICNERSLGKFLQMQGILVQNNKPRYKSKRSVNGNVIELYTIDARKLFGNHILEDETELMFF